MVNLGVGFTVILICGYHISHEAGKSYMSHPNEDSMLPQVTRWWTPLAPPAFSLKSPPPAFITSLIHLWSNSAAGGFKRRKNDQGRGNIWKLYGNYFYNILCYYCYILCNIAGSSSIILLYFIYIYSIYMGIRVRNWEVLHCMRFTLRSISISGGLSFFLFFRVEQWQRSQRGFSLVFEVMFVHLPVTERMLLSSFFARAVSTVPILFLSCHGCQQQQLWYGTAWDYWPRNLLIFCWYGIFPFSFFSLPGPLVHAELISLSLHM